MLNHSWKRCWADIGASGDGVELQQCLLQAYEQPQRKYHTTQHLSECLTLLDHHLDLAQHPAEVIMALWFHDAVYNVKASDNEAQSAQWAERALQQAGVAPECISRIGKLILATRHNALPRGQDQALLVDIDLAILGAERLRFDEYEAQVREEYAWVPGFLFRRKRRTILAEFLARTPIFHTPRLRRLLEIQARENLQYSLDKLQG